MKQRILFIINPVSGIGKQKTVEKALEIYLDKEKFDYSIAYTEYAHHATEIAKQATKENFDIVVAVGGDGSINDCVKGLINSDVKLGIIPAGSGNGLARCLHIPLDINKAIEVINNSNSINIDTVNLNEHTYASVAGIGFDALIAKEFTGNTTRGFQTYMRLVLKDYINYKPKKYRMILDDKEIETEALFVSFMNSNQFGYNAVIAPKASLSDGLLDVVIVKKVPLVFAPLVIQMLFFHKFDRALYVDTYRVKHAEVLEFDDGLINLDGEGIEFSGNKIEFTVNPSNLNVIIPQEHNKQPFISEEKIKEFIRSITNEQK